MLKTWQVPPPSTVDDEKLVTHKGPYVPLRSVELTNAYPVLQGYKNYVGVGYHFNFDDPLQFASLGDHRGLYAEPRALPPNERGHVDVTGRYKFWTAALSWNRSDFYDLFGPTKRSRKGYAAKLGYDWRSDLRRAAQAATLIVRLRVLRPDRHAARRAERRRPTSPAS